MSKPGSILVSAEAQVTVTMKHLAAAVTEGLDLPGKQVEPVLSGLAF